MTSSPHSARCARCRKTGHRSSSLFALWLPSSIEYVASEWKLIASTCIRKTWTLDSGLDSSTGLWTEIWTGFWTDTQFNNDHFQHSVALNGLGYALVTAYPVCSKTRLLFMPFTSMLL